MCAGEPFSQGQHRSTLLTNKHKPFLSCAYFDFNSATSNKECTLFPPNQRSLGGVGVNDASPNKGFFDPLSTHSIPFHVGFFPLQINKPLDVVVFVF